MKALGSLASLAALALALTPMTFAAGKNEAGFTLPNAAQIGATDLRPGDYKAEWQPASGGAVKVEIMQHGKTVATAQATLKNLQGPAPFDAVVTHTLSNNTSKIDEIDFGKRKEALVFGAGL
jgi:hypothetical protein